jgi:hypothetical protein
VESGAVGEADGGVFAVGCCLMEAEDGGAALVANLCEAAAGLWTSKTGIGVASYRGREKEPGAGACLWVIGVVGDFAADVAIFLMFFENLHIERHGRLRMRQRPHHFFHAGEDVRASLLPIGGRVYWSAAAVGL